MKITCPKNQFLYGVNTVSKAVSNKTTMEILQCILIEAFDDCIKLTANDTELGIETVIQGTILEPGKIALEAKIFSEIIKKIPDNDVYIETDEAGKTNIECEQIQCSIMGRKGDDFSHLPEIEKENKITLSQFDLKEVIRQTIFSVSDNENNKLMTGELLSIADGNLYDAQILGIRKGEKGNPGELSGLIRYDADNILGEISENSKNGIFGIMDAWRMKNLDLKKIPIGYKQDLKTGPASILCCTDGEVKEYAAEITRIDMNHEDSNKSFVIQITDKELLEKTGGIVQGMSGSPVLQNGKLFGAVTHVFVQDSTGGYGIFIENMTGNA